MNVKPLISIIIPTHNHARFLQRSVDSVLQQTYKHTEIIIIDDGSTDDTTSVVNKLKNKRIRFISQPQRGVTAARNLGIKNSHGDYIAFLDSDDAWLPSKLEKQLSVFHQPKFPQLGLVYCFHYWSNPKGKTNGVNQIFNRGIIWEKLLRGNFIAGSCSSVLIKTECFEKVGIFDEALLGAAEDWEMWIRIARHYQVDYVPEPLVIITRHPAQRSNKKTQVIKRLKVLIKNSQHLKAASLNGWGHYLVSYQKLLEQLLED